MTDWVAFGDLHVSAAPDAPTTPHEANARASDDSGGDVPGSVRSSGAPAAEDSRAARFAQSTTTRSSATRHARTPFVFDGPTGEFFVLYLKNIALTLITLGIYKFWAQVAIRRWIYQHSSFLKSRFDYHATGKERFFAFLKAMLVLGPMILTFVGLHYVLVDAGFGGEEAFTLCFYGFFFVFFLLRPLIVVSSMRFRLARTSWAGMRFRFSGSVKDCYALYMHDLFLMIVTLGFYGAWHHVNVRRFKAENSDLGGEHFEFRGSALEYLGLLMVGTMLSYMTLGLFLPWLIAWIHRFNTDNLYFQGKPFKSHLTGLEVLGMAFVGFVVVVCTVGIGIPWVIKMFVEKYINSTEYSGTVDLEALKGSYDKGASAFVEGLGEAGEALEALGDVFGG
jgi:uncharacterized membrane protein YjgN (DUF898 family)